MNIIVTSLFVDNQDKALKFYTDVLGFVKNMTSLQVISDGLLLYRRTMKMVRNLSSNRMTISRHRIIRTA